MPRLIFLYEAIPRGELHPTNMQGNNALAQSFCITRNHLLPSLLSRKLPRKRLAIGFRLNADFK
jgi:hypothetical protein